MWLPPFCASTPRGFHMGFPKAKSACTLSHIASHSTILITIYPISKSPIVTNHVAHQSQYIKLYYAKFTRCNNINMTQEEKKRNVIKNVVIFNLNCFCSTHPRKIEFLSLRNTIRGKWRRVWWHFPNWSALRYRSFIERIPSEVRAAFPESTRISISGKYRPS